MLKVGSRGPEVKQWEGFLALHSWLEGPVDDIFGPKVDAATKIFQHENGLEEDGVVGPACYRKAFELGFRVSGARYEFVPAKYFTPGRHGAQIEVVVFHTMELPKKPRMARLLAERFSNPARQVSSHYSADDTEVIQSVLESDTAWCAPGANTNGIHVEHAGFSSQWPKDWADDYSTKMLEVSARLVARICKDYSLPVQWLDEAALLREEKGITGHLQVSRAFKKGDHGDPGPNFPIDHYIDLVIGELAELR